MRTRRSLLRVAAFAVTSTVLLLAACSDRDVSSLTGVQRKANLGSPSLDAQINTLIGEIFRQGHAASVRARWENTKREVMNNPEGRKKHVALVRWMQSKTSDVTPVGDETQEHAVARLVLLFSLYLYGGPATEPPVITPETDATLEIMEPTETDTAVTPAEQAAVIFPAGAANEPTVVVVRENEEAMAEFTQHCSGPLPTTRCQYPVFYKFDVFPDVRLNTPATVAVCRVPTETRHPRADHDRFRLAHQTPSDPAAYHPEGTIEGGIEILPFVTTGHLTECEGEELEHEIGSIREEGGVLRYVAAHARRGVGRFAGAIGDFLTPKSLYAIDRGGGGSVFMFSDFNMIDPGSQADLFVPGDFTATQSSVIRGSSLTLNAFSIDNDGTGSAGAFTSTIVLAPNAELTGGVALETHSLTGMNPEAPHTVASHAVTIPETTTPGTYWIGVRVDAGSAVLEDDETNNVRSMMITVTDPFTLFCPEGPEGSYGNMQDAVDATAVGGELRICNGTFTVNNVLVNKPMTIRSQNPGGAWLANPSATGVAMTIDGIESGTVTVTDVGFIIQGNGQAGHGIDIGRTAVISGPPAEPTGVDFPGRWDQVEISNSRFHGTAGTGIGVYVLQNGGAAANRLHITGSHFDQNFIGVFIVSHSRTDIDNSLFENFAAGSATYSGFNPSANSAWHRLAYGDFTDNEVRNCGLSGCFRGVLMTNGTIARNTFDAGPGGSKLLGILVTRPPTTPHPRQPIVIEDNVITGGFISGDAIDPDAWRLKDGIHISDNAGVTSIVRRNQVSGTNMGLRAGADLNAHDNSIINGYGGTVPAGPRAVNFNRNDVTGNVQWFLWTTGHNLTCNWYGTVGAPPPGAVQPVSTPNSAYYPRADGPIANNPDQTCTVAPPAGGPGVGDPAPVLAYTRAEQETVGTNDIDRYRVSVTNRLSYSAEMFAAAPDLPPCGLNTNSSQTWVDIYDAGTNSRLNGFCGFSSPEDLNSIWFSRPRWVVPPFNVYVKLTDRRNNVVYTSAPVPVIGPIFTNFPRTFNMSGSHPNIAGATNVIEVEYCSSWASPDWRTCLGPWQPWATIPIEPGLFSENNTFVGDQPGRWRTVARNEAGAIVGTTAFRNFRFITAP